MRVLTQVKKESEKLKLMIKKKKQLKEYESKRTRVFCDSWSKDRKWLKYDEENKVMTCVLCIQHYSVNEIMENMNLRGQNTFLTGSSNLKKRQLRIMKKVKPIRKQLRKMLLHQDQPQRYSSLPMQEKP